MLVVVFFFQESADFAATLLDEFQGLLDDLVASVSCPCHCINYMTVHVCSIYHNTFDSYTCIMMLLFLMLVIACTCTSIL